MHELIERSVEKMLLDPNAASEEAKDPKESFDSVDMETLAKNSKSAGMRNIASEIASHNLNLNLTFSEPSLLHNLSEQIEQRHIIAEYCFESLGVESISFAKQASLHLYSDCKYNGIVVDLGAELT
jgi:actin-related protein